MRNRRRLIGVLLVVLASVAVLLLVWRPWQAPRSFATAEELGYHFEYEIDPATEHLHQSNPDRDGKEYVGVVVSGHYSVMILDGALTVNREARGTVQKGDRIKVALDRRVWVNGSERRP
jgi:hypothetical protein